MCPYTLLVYSSIPYNDEVKHSCGRKKLVPIYKIKMNMLLVLLVKAKMDFAICYRELATWFSLPLPLVLLKINLSDLCPL
jgi:hypothetical protein